MPRKWGEGAQGSSGIRAGLIPTRVSLSCTTKTHCVFYIIWRVQRRGCSRRAEMTAQVLSRRPGLYMARPGARRACPRQGLPNKPYLDNSVVRRGCVSSHYLWDCVLFPCDHCSSAARRDGSDPCRGWGCRSSSDFSGFAYWCHSFCNSWFWREKKLCSWGAMGFPRITFSPVEPQNSLMISTSWLVVWESTWFWTPWQSHFSKPP